MQLHYIFVVIATVTSVAVAHTSLEKTSAVTLEESGNIEDIMNVVILDANTNEEKQMLAAHVKVMIEDITDVAKRAVAIIEKNKKLLNKAVSAIESAKDMVEDGEDVGAVELMQTILLAKIQDMLIESSEESVVLSTDPPTTKSVEEDTVDAEVSEK